VTIYIAHAGFLWAFPKHFDILDRPSIQLTESIPECIDQIAWVDEESLEQFYPIHPVISLPISQRVQHLQFLELNSSHRFNRGFGLKKSSLFSGNQRTFL
jgi:hypothetical protein